jgi:phosphate transport system ATP-binding protein
VPKWLTIVRIVLPTSSPASRPDHALDLRVIGETAPLLIVAGFTTSMNYNPFSERMMSLPVFVYNQYVSPGTEAQFYIERAWAGRPHPHPDRRAAEHHRPRRVLLLLAEALPLTLRPIPKAKQCPSASKSAISTSTTASFLAVEGVSLNIEPRASPPSSVRPDAASRRSSAPSTACTRSSPARGSRARCSSTATTSTVPGVDPVLVRRQVGMVFQRPNPFPTMSIKENVLAGVKLNNRKITKSDADELVERSLKGANLWNEVKDRLDKPGSGLSGGSSSVSASRARSRSRPEVILMDEPCSALDPISTLAIEDLIEELKQDYTIVIVTHNMQQASRVSDRTAFFNIAGTGKPGKLIEYDDTTTMFSKPSVQATEDYVSGKFG